MTSRSLAIILVCLLLAVVNGQPTVAISSCTSSHGQDKCHEAFDGISTQSDNGWRYGKPGSATWGKFQLAEASEVSGVSIVSEEKGRSLKKFSIECYQGETVVPVTNVRLISGQGASINGNMVAMAAKRRTIRVDFDPVPGCTAVQLNVFKTFNNKRKLSLTELSILTGTVFYKAAETGACLATEIADIGKVLGNSPHTIQVRTTFPESGPNTRQWLLNLGQHNKGANHWIWNSNTQIQFGTWNGRQIKAAVINECTFLTTTFSGSVLKLYCDGVFMAEKTTEFSINSPQLSIGVVPSSHPGNAEADFAGCITEVTVHSYEKSAAEVAQQNPPAFWKTCRWQTVRDQHLSDTQDLMGWTCADNEILTGFEINHDNEDDVSKIRCCELGGHSSVIPDTCTFIEVGDSEFQPESATCNANDHMVFTGVYDERMMDGDDYTEVLVGKCCEVKCDAPWCHECNDWGVNTDKCLTVTADPDINGAQDLVCPEGRLLTQIHDGHSAAAHGIQRVESVECCKLDLISSPSKAPTTSPTTNPSPAPTTAPSPSPTYAPSPSPTEFPSPSPTTSPSPAPTSTPDCLLALFQCDPPLSDAEIIQGIDDCLPDCVVPQLYHRRVLEGRLLFENAE